LPVSAAEGDLVAGLLADREESPRADNFTLNGTWIIRDTVTNKHDFLFKIYHTNLLFNPKTIVGLILKNSEILTGFHTLKHLVLL